MKLIQNIINSSDTKNQNYRTFLLLLFLTLLAILPNALLFSTDEMAIYMDPRPLYGLGVAQAEDGRYSYAAVCWILSILNMDYQSFVVLSMVSYAFGLATLYFSLFKTARQDINSSALLGFMAFLTFGLSLDQMQFDVQSLQYAACLFAVSTIAMLVSSSRKPLNILVIGTAIFACGIGFYQNILQITAYFILALLVLQNAGNRAWKPMLKQASLMAGCAVLGSVFYVLINTTLKHMGAPWFQNYPVRTLGISYALKNFPKYLLTIPQAFGIIGHRYTTLLPYIVALLILAVTGFYFSRCWKQGQRQRVIAVLLVFSALLVLPNPANLLLAGFWPTARTLCAFALFLAVLVTLASHNKIGVWFALILVATQSGVVVKNYAQRLNQWVADTAVAENLIFAAYQNTPVGTQPKIVLGVLERDMGIASPRPYAYGISMFNESWSAATFVHYISGGKVNVLLDDGTVCSTPQKTLTITPTKDGINACFAHD